MNRERVEAVVFHYLYSLRYNPARLAELILPVFELLIWGFTAFYLKSLFRNELSVLSLLVGGLVFWIIVYRSQRGFVSPLIDSIKGGTIQNFLASPLTVLELIIGSILASFVKLLLTIVIIFLISALLFKFNIFVFGLLLIPYIINLLVFGWSLGIVASALLVRFGLRVVFFSWATAALVQPLSCVFYAREVLPTPIKALSWLVPTSYIFEGMRGIIQFGSFDQEGLVLACLLNIFYLFNSFLFFKLMFYWARRRGVIPHL